MKAAGRKVLYTVHVLSSVGWAGALAVFLAHATAAVWASDLETIRAAALAMWLASWFVILPLALAALASGIVQAWVTPWGLLRHGWIVAKLALTVIATAVLFAKLGPIADLASEARLPFFDPSVHSHARMSMLAHAVGGLAILVGASLLAIYKPAGVLRWPNRSRA